GAEVGVNGVVVNLYAASDLTAILATDTTINGGYYLFDYLEAGDYVVVIPNSNFTTGNLIGYWSSSTTLGADGALNETAAPDADTIATDSDDNGTQTNFASTREVMSLPITLGTGNSEPTGETDLNGGSDGDQPDNRANMTVDFGFYKTAIGDLVWLDVTTVDGAYAVGETLVNGAAVSLYSTNGTEIPVGPDGILGSADDALGGVLTVNGIYAFSGLPSGSYVVRVVGPTGTVSTTDAFNPADTTTPNNNVNNNDNGVGVLGNSVSANTFNMTPGTSGVVTDNNGTTTNNTIDFGFAYTYALGNRVWFDTDNDSLIDFPSESVDGLNKIGVDGVTVQLYAASDLTTVLATDTTINGGYYLFDGLFPGNYVVVIPAANFTGAGVLTGYWSSATTRNLAGTISETTAALTELNIDSDDNGTLQISGDVISSAVTLGPAGLTEPTAETDVDAAELGADHQGLQPDGRANMTVDFGFYRVEVGNIVFADANTNGLYDILTDSLFPGVTVELYTGDGNTLIASTLTDVSGVYQFSGLPQGNYVIHVTAPAGIVSTIDTGHATDNNTPNDNIDNNDNGDGILGGVVS
ncbi:MAG: SdrD B-like domain-containing protein, partial [Anaerolineales bacterium]|nr:SdrD B-like domain-containing protein [Anaerolineales bacterium]